MLYTISAAARALHIDRRTVERYVRRFPEIMDGNKVVLPALAEAIDRFKERDGRGFPLGKKRGRPLPLAGVPKKPPAIFRRPLHQRLEIIRREMDCMTNQEQEEVLARVVSLFRWEVVAKARDKQKERRTQ